MVTWYCEPTAIGVFVSVTQFVVLRLEFCCGAKPLKDDGQEISTVFVSLSEIVNDGTRGWNLSFGANAK